MVNEEIADEATRPMQSPNGLREPNDLFAMEADIYRWKRLAHEPGDTEDSLCFDPIARQNAFPEMLCLLYRLERIFLFLLMPQPFLNVVEHSEILAYRLWRMAGTPLPFLFVWYDFENGKHLVRLRRQLCASGAP
jgi:hypothetical protein